MTPDRTDTPATTPSTGQQWTGLDQFANVPGFSEAAQNEFPDGATEFADETSRRHFLKIMTASVALATAAGCNLRPAAQRKIVPYSTQPDEITPGIPIYFASAAPLGGYGQGVLVRSNEGRPTKIEGNPDHPSSLGGASVHSLASVLDVYDPDRSATITLRGGPRSYEEAVNALRGKLDVARGKKGAGLRILTETVTSPTLASQIGKLLTDADFPHARWVQFDPVGGNALAGSKLVVGGAGANVVYDFVRADVVVSLDSDFLTSGPGHVRYNRDFADRRKVRQGFVEENKADRQAGKTREEINAGRVPGQPFREGVASPDLMSRVYAIESYPTNVGAVADHRLSLKASQIESFARLLASKLGLQVPAGEALPELANKWADVLAAELNAKKGASVVVAGDHLPPFVHALALAINQHLGNLEPGKTVQITAPVEARPDGKVIDLPTLASEMVAGQVETLLILGGANPVYSAPADVDFGGALREMSKDGNKLTFHLGGYQDETAVLCQWHVNEAHYLEAWGDIRGHDGTVAIQQPLIAPLHGGRSAIELLADATNAPQREGLDIVRAYWRNADEVKKTFPGFTPPQTFERFWQEAVRGGFVPGTAAQPVAAPKAGSVPAVPAWAPPGNGEYEINFRADPTLHDGRFANNGWLQELPKPLTKIAWDNAAYMSPRTAAKLGVTVGFRWTAGEHGRAEVDLIELKTEIGGVVRTVKAPVWILPGHADDSITLHLGHGRTRAGQYVGNSPGDENRNAEGAQTHGFDAYRLRTAGAAWTTRAVQVAKTNGDYFLACTQGHWVMYQKDPISGKILDRKPVRHGTVAELKHNPKFAKIPPVAAAETEGINDNVPRPVQKGEPVPTSHKHGGHAHNGHGDAHDPRLHPLTMYNPSEDLAPDLRDEQRRRWGMAIDLSACTGCSACVVACQSENNIPVVGKKEVTRGREMHWLNIDRYYEGLPGDDPTTVKTYFQPRACVQCENAPCEIVCPVGATVHSSDGLNDMTYNRCVGTRYCSNNCPYKVRRFNFLSFADWETETIKLGRNPDVSVRSRGVMEKCTFCVQRIRGAEIVAEREQRSIKDGEILTACQSACPSGAIVFGDINNANAVVSQWKNEPTNYGLLAELNTRPRLTYLAAIRNPNPALS